MTLATIYKLTDEHMRTHGGFQWELGKEFTTTGWLHAYTHPLLAALLNPIHANIENPRLFEGRGEIGKTDNGLKIGCTRIVLERELPTPWITMEMRVRFAILCAKAVYKEPEWIMWAENWENGTDRSYAAAYAAASASANAARAAASAAANAARAAAYAAADAARAAAYAAADAAYAAVGLRQPDNHRAADAAYAARAAAYAAEKPLDLIALAEQAVREGAK